MTGSPVPAVLSRGSPADALQPGTAETLPANHADLELIRRSDHRLEHGDRLENLTRGES